MGGELNGFLVKDVTVAKIEGEVPGALVGKESRAEIGGGSIHQNGRTNGPGADEAVVAGNPSWGIGVGLGFPEEFAGGSFETIGKTVVGSKQQAILRQGGGKSHGSIGKEGPEGFTSVEVDTANLVVSRGAKIGSFAVSNEMEGSVVGNPWLEVVLVVPKVLLGGRWPGGVGGMVHFT